MDYQWLHYDNPQNKSIHLSQWQSIERATISFEPEQIRRLRGRLSVKQPEFIYLRQLEQGLLLL